MENWLIYAPCAVFVVTLIVQLGIFARAEELKKTEAELIKYMAEQYISKEDYKDNHKSLQEDLTQMRQDIADVKNLLINIVTNNHISNN